MSLATQSAQADGPLAIVLAASFCIVVVYEPPFYLLLLLYSGQLPACLLQHRLVAPIPNQPLTKSSRFRSGLIVDIASGGLDYH